MSPKLELKNNEKLKKINKKSICIGLVISVVTTICLLNCSNSLFVGIPIFIYSLLPVGLVFLVLETYVLSFLLFLLVWRVSAFKRRYVFYILIIIIFFGLNILATEFTDFELDVNMLDILIP